MNEYRATDGTVFTSRDAYKKHEMEKYTFRDRTFSKLIKEVGSIQGQPFDIANCKNCTLVLLDNCDQVQIDDLSGESVVFDVKLSSNDTLSSPPPFIHIDCQVFIGASSGSIFIRNCHNCSFTIAGKQLRTRDCKNCTINLYCKTEPIIETSTEMTFASFNGAYPGHYKAMLDADLDPCINQWHKVYDFNDPSKSQKNWRYVTREEEEPLWCPLGEAECCIPSFLPTRQSMVSSDGSDIARNSVGDVVNTDEMDNTVGKEAPPPTDEFGGLYRFKVLGQRAWGLLSHSFSAGLVFCMGFVFSAMQRPLSLLTYWGFRQDE